MTNKLFTIRENSTKSIFGMINYICRHLDHLKFILIDFVIKNTTFSQLTFKERTIAYL